MTSEQSLSRLSKKILRLARIKNAEVDIYLLPDAEITKLKRRFIKKKTEPNVLSFSEPIAFPHPETKKKYLGEVYLNKDILKGSPERAVPLLIHGIVHLLGYDHEKKRDATKMEAFEDALLKKLG